MTCFWNGIIQRLNNEDYKIIGIQPLKKRNINDIKNFINHLKKISEKNNFNIKWQNKDLNDIEKTDLKTFIKEYNVNGIGGGHLTSSCDPFLCLLTDLLKCKIEFNYCNHKILFESKDNIRKTFQFRGTRGHFS